MTKNKSKYIPSTTRNLSLLWIVSLLPIPALMLGSSFGDNFLFVTIIVALLATLLIGVFLPHKKDNLIELVIPASILVVTNLALALDYWNEVSSNSTNCGTGFSAGNCFLLDGLGILYYIPVVPVLMIIANILFTRNILRKSQR